jgi:hypothetical protein
MELTHTPLSRDDLDKINERIRELTAKIKESNERQEKYDGTIQMLPEVFVWNRELRQLRRQRDNNEN